MNEMLGDGPSLTTIWAGFLGLGLIGFGLSIFRWWASIPIIVLLGLWSIALLDDLYAPDLYPVYMRIDSSFVPSATIAMAAGLTLPIIGIAINFGRRLKKAI